VASAVRATRDIQIADQRADDEEPAAGVAHDVLGQTRVVRKAGTAIERVQDRYVTTDVERERNLTAAVANDVAEQFAEDEFGQAGIGVGRAAIAQYGDDVVPRRPCGSLIADRKHPPRVAFGRTRRTRNRDRGAVDANRQDRNVVDHFLEDVIADRRRRVRGVPNLEAA